MISVYAPTYQSCRDVKAEFYNDLQVSLDSVPKDDLLISWMTLMLGLEILLEKRILCDIMVMFVAFMVLER